MLCRNKKAGGLPFYDFMPGWFNEIAVEHYLFVWEDGTYVMETNADRKEGGFYVWEGGLKEGERRHMTVSYTHLDVYKRQGSYHYHCGGHPAHLHPNGVCPYSGASAATSSSSKNIQKTAVQDSDAALRAKYKSVTDDFSNRCV